MHDGQQAVDLEHDLNRAIWLGYCRSILLRHVYSTISIQIDPIPLQLVPCHIDFPHQLLMRLGYIVECKYAPSQLEKKVGTEGHQSPERELSQASSASQQAMGIWGVKEAVRLVSLRLGRFW